MREGLHKKKKRMVRYRDSSPIAWQHTNGGRECEVTAICNKANTLALDGGGCINTHVGEGAAGMQNGANVGSRNQLKLILLVILQSYLTIPDQKTEISMQYATYRRTVKLWRYIHEKTIWLIIILMKNGKTTVLQLM